MAFKLWTKKLFRFALHLVRKPFLNNFCYKYFPRLFLFMRLGQLENINTSVYWSNVHSLENDSGNLRFDTFVLNFLSGIDFKNKDVLDVGCGRGTFLEQLTMAKSLTGVDISEVAVAEIKKKGIEGHVRVLPELYLDKKYDIITCFETLEHVTKWQKTIKNILEHLREDGFLLLAVPFENAIMMGEHVTYFDVPRLYNFLRPKIRILEIKILGPWFLIIAVNKKNYKNKIDDYFKS